MATIGDIVLRTEEILYGMGVWERPDFDTLDGGINASVTSLDTDLTFWVRGDYMEFITDAGTPNEIVHVQAFSGNTATVKRGVRNSTAATQVDGAEIRRNPDFPRVSIEQKVQDIMDTPGVLWPHVWTWHTDSLTFTTDDHLYDLDQYVEDVVAVYQSNIDSDGKFAPIDNGLWDVVRELDSNVTTNGSLLRLGRVWDEDTTVYYTAKRRPAYADLANIDAELANLLPRAAAAELLMARAPQLENASRRSGRANAGRIYDIGTSMKEQFRRDLDGFRRALLVEHPPKPKYRHRFQRRW